MPASSDDETPETSPSTTAGIRGIFWPATPARDPADIVPANERKAAMASLDSLEVKLCTGALLISAVFGIAIPAAYSLEHKVTHRGKHTVTVAPDAWLVGGAIVLLAIVGLVAIWRRRRTLVTFDLVFIGFAFTSFIGLVGFAFIFLGGWLFLRAWRLNRNGTVSGKVAARQSAERRAAGKSGSTASTKTKGGTKGASSTAERKAPTASKRYTPKAAPKKKVPKPAD